LITRSTASVASSGSPSGRPPAFAGVVASGCVGTQPPTRVGGQHSNSTGGQLSGSDRFRVLGSTGAHIRFASAVPRIRPTSGDPSGSRLTILVPSGLRRVDLPPARPTTYLRFASDAVLWLGWRSHPACAACSPAPPSGFHLRIAPAAFTLRLHRPQDHSACASRSLLRLNL